MLRLQSITDALLGPRADAWVGRATVWTALIGFLVHLSLWALLASGVWSFGRETVLLQSPLLALYTPFSILLAYEVFQLIRVIPESFSASIGKQFEVITLIVARESLVYLAGLSSADFEAIGPWILPLLVKGAAFVTLLTVSLAIGLEGAGGLRRRRRRTRRYVAIKQGMSVGLLGVFLVMAIFSVGSWTADAVRGDGTVTPHLLQRLLHDPRARGHLHPVDVLPVGPPVQRPGSKHGVRAPTVIMRIALDAPIYADAILFMIAAVVGFLVLWITNRLDSGPDDGRGQFEQSSGQAG